MTDPDATIIDHSAQSPCPSTEDINLLPGSVEYDPSQFSSLERVRMAVVTLKSDTERQARISCTRLRRAVAAPLSLSVSDLDVLNDFARNGHFRVEEAQEMYHTSRYCTFILDLLTGLQSPTADWFVHVANRLHVKCYSSNMKGDQAISRAHAGHTVYMTMFNAYAAQEVQS